MILLRAKNDVSPMRLDRSGALGIFPFHLRCGWLVPGVSAGRHEANSFNAREASLPAVAKNGYYSSTVKLPGAPPSTRCTTSLKLGSIALALSVTTACSDRSLELFPSAAVPLWCTQVCSSDGGSCSGEACIACGSDRDCPVATPRCELASRTCVQCLTAAECPTGDVCNLVMHECVPSCAGGTTCGSGEVCNLDRICVECMQNSDCQDPAQHCLLPQQKCSQ
jgi:hypothetical protein